MTSEVWDSIEPATYLILIGLAITECVLTLYINIMDLKVRERGPTAFANSLAVAIGLVSFISALFNIIIIASDSKSLYTGWWWCLMQRICLRYLHSVSSLSVTCLALDRYVAICWPLHYVSLLTPRRCNMLAAACWVSGFLLLIAPTISAYRTGCQTFTPFLITYSILYLLSTFVALTLYILVYLEFKRHPVSTMSSTQVSSFSEDERILQSRTIRATLLMAFLYTLLSFPQIVLQLIYQTVKPNTLRTWLRVSGVMHRCHFLLFLPLYAWNNATFRQALARSARRICSAVVCRTPQTDDIPLESAVSRSRSELKE